MEKNVNCIFKFWKKKIIWGELKKVIILSENKLFLLIYLEISFPFQRNTSSSFCVNVKSNSEFRIGQTNFESSNSMKGVFFYTIWICLNDFSYLGSTFEQRQSQVDKVAKMKQIERTKDSKSFFPGILLNVYKVFEIVNNCLAILCEWSACYSE